MFSAIMRTPNGVVLTLLACFWIDIS